MLQSKELFLLPGTQGIYVETRIGSGEEWRGARCTYPLLAMVTTIETISNAAEMGTENHGGHYAESLQLLHPVQCATSSLTDMGDFLGV